MKNNSNIKSGNSAAPISDAVQTLPDYLKLIILSVSDSWELPDANQYDYAREGYVEHLQQPFIKLEKDRRLKTVLVTHKVEQMIELAPQFFEKALSRSVFETGYFIEEGKNDDE